MKEKIRLPKQSSAADCREKIIVKMIDFVLGRCYYYKNE